MITYFAEFHEIVPQGAGDKRPQTAAHMDIGFDAASGAFFESNRMAGARLDPIHCGGSIWCSGYGARFG